MTFKNITRLVSILAVTALAVALCCCSQPKKYRIGVSQCSSDDWRQKMNEEIMREAMFHDNIEIEILSADDSNEKQIADIQSFVDRGFDIIIAAPNEAEALTPIIKEIYESGTPVILFDRNINGDSYTAYQGADNLEVGRQMALKAYSLIGKGGNVIEIYGLQGSTPAIERRQGFDAKAAELGLNIIATGYGNWTHDGSYRVADSLLRLYPAAQLIYAHNDRMAIAAAKAAKDLNLHGIKIIGVDAAPSIGVKAVADSIIDATILYPTEGYQVIRTAINILEGKPYEHKLIFSSPMLIDDTNAEIILLQDQALREETSKISILGGKINAYWKQHSLQTALLYTVVVILILLAGVIFLLLRAYWSRIRHHQQIEARNQELAQQKEEIASQRDELDSLYHQLQDATQSKLTFFTNVSHDLRTPLTLIADPVAQLAEAKNLDSQQHTLMQLANKNVKILMRLINQILDIRKYDNGKLNLNLTNVDLATALQEWSLAFANAARKRHISLNVDIQKDADLTTAVDIDKIERVIFNLISNAFKFTPENGKITLTAYREADSIIIKVADTGCGIPTEAIAHIFDRFFKTDNVNPHGSGIGLALTKVFVEMHKGTIGVESSHETGTEFTITLPVTHAEANEEQKSTPIYIDVEKDAAELSAVDNDEVQAVEDSEVVLVIDDNPDICTLIKTILGDKYTVVQAHNGTDGIRMSLKYIPDLIICDVMMPGIDGFETCRRIKGEMITSHIPLLMLTACSQDVQRTEGYESGADGYLSKPFDSNMLKARCAALISNRKRILESMGKDTPHAPAEAKKTPKRDIDDEFYNKFVDTVEAEMSNPDITVEDIADKIGMSRVQMYRKIKALTNYSPTDILRNTRLKRASTLLKTTSQSISEIAYAVGFSSPSYFTKCYKEYFNETPGETQSRTSKA